MHIYQIHQEKSPFCSKQSQLIGQLNYFLQNSFLLHICIYMYIYILEKHWLGTTDYFR